MPPGSSHTILGDSYRPGSVRLTEKIWKSRARTDAVCPGPLATATDTPTAVMLGPESAWNVAGRKPCAVVQFPTLSAAIEAPDTRSISNSRVKG